VTKSSPTLSHLRLIDATMEARSWAKAQKTPSVDDDVAEVSWSCGLFVEIISDTQVSFGFQTFLTIEHEGLRSSHRPRWEGEAA
jgi:hypothetical protein